MFAAVCQDVAVVLKENYRPTEKEVKEVMQWMDSSKDGTISFEEYSVHLLLFFCLGCTYVYMLCALDAGREADPEGMGLIRSWYSVQCMLLQ